MQRLGDRGFRLAITIVIGLVGPEIWLGVPAGNVEKKPTKIAPDNPSIDPGAEAMLNARSGGKATTAAVSPP